MRFVERGSLAQRISKGSFPRSNREAVELVAKLARAVLLHYVVNELVVAHLTASFANELPD